MFLNSLGRKHPFAPRHIRPKPQRAGEAVNLYPPLKTSFAAKHFSTRYVPFRQNPMSSAAGLLSLIFSSSQALFKKRGSLSGLLVIFTSPLSTNGSTPQPPRVTAPPPPPTCVNSQHFTARVTSTSCALPTLGCVRALPLSTLSVSRSALGVAFMRRCSGGVYYQGACTCPFP